MMQLSLPIIFIIHLAYRELELFQVLFVGVIYLQTLVVWCSLIKMFEILSFPPGIVVTDIYDI